ncbi:MAG: histidinol-phosphate transaminase [Verrucomicrobia bacterium]|nr:histidinol-phosphate transaminase [Verrucomicrobiota bacterium]
MSLPLNPALASLPVYQPGRPIEEVARELGLPPASIIKMASNENPFGPSPLALAAMESALRHTPQYPDGNSFYLKNRLAEKLAVQPTQLIFGSGSNEILEFVGHALLAPGDEVVVSQYCFAVYPIVTHLFGAKMVTVPARNFGHDLPAMLQAVTPKTKVMFVANPNNPMLLVMDEAYLEFIERPTDLLPLIRAGSHPNLLLARTFSKIYGLAGLRLGYGIGHVELMAAFEKIRQPFNVNLVAQAGALAALDDTEHVRRSRTNNLAGLKWFEHNLRRLGIEFVPSSANFILVKVGHGTAVFEAMQKEGVIVRPMGIYQLPEWVRISIGTPDDNARCLATLQKALGAAVMK